MTGPAADPAAVTAGDVASNRAQRRAAGYVRRRRVYLIDFDGTDLAGLEVRARGVSLDRFLSLLDLSSLVEDMNISSLTEEQAGAIRGLFAGFAKALVSWNLQEPLVDDHGNETGEVRDVPPTLEGLYSQDIELVITIIEHWMDAVAGVSGPLEQRSAGGGQPPAASLPMEPRSPNPPS